MKILFIVPPYYTTDVLTAPLYPMPYGTVCVATAFKAAGHEVAVLDLLAEPGAHKGVPVPPPPSFEGLGAPPYYRFGPSPEEVSAIIKREGANADVFGVTSGPCNVWEGTKSVMDALHKHFPRKRVMMGGSFATASPQEVFDLLSPDVLFAGEGEAAVEHEKEILDTGGYYYTTLLPQRKELISPDWSVLLGGLGAYPRVHGKMRGVISTSRGCPHGCEFCAVPVGFPGPMRFKPASQISEEIKQLWYQRVRYFTFLDDNLLCSPARAGEIFEAIRYLRRSIPGFARTSIAFYNEEGLEVRMAAQTGLVDEMKMLGFTNIGIGLETLNVASRSAAKKPYTSAQLSTAMTEFKKARTIPRAFYILGFEHDTMQSVAEDFIKFVRMGVAVRANNLKLYPNTPLHRRLVLEGKVEEPIDWRTSSFYTHPNGELTFTDIKKWKTYFGAVGTLAEEYDINLMDAITINIAKLQRAGFTTELNCDGIILRGKFWRATALRYFCELAMIFQSTSVFPGRGVRSTVTPGQVAAYIEDAPHNAQQNAIISAFHSAK